MNYTKITETNLHLIIHQLKQFIKKNGRISYQYFYPTNKHFKENYKLDFISHSILYVKEFDSEEVEIVRPFSEPFIRIGNLFFNIGEKIKITSTHITLIKKANHSYHKDTIIKVKSTSRQLSHRDN